MKAQELFENTVNKLNTPLVAGMVVLLIAAGIANTIWNTTTSLTTAPTNNPANLYTPPPANDLNALPNYHVMGASPSSLHDLPLASLGAILLGIFVNPNGQSSALISISGGETKNYVVGDALAANVVIEKILPNSVVVKHNGRLEQLQMQIQPIQFSDAQPTSLWAGK